MLPLSVVLKGFRYVSLPLCLFLTLSVMLLSTISWLTVVNTTEYIPSWLLSSRVTSNDFYKDLANVFTQVIGWYSIFYFFFIFMDFLSRTFTIHVIAIEGRSY